MVINIVGAPEARGLSGTPCAAWGGSKYITEPRERRYYGHSDVYNHNIASREALYLPMLRMGFLIIPAAPPLRLGR